MKNSKFEIFYSIAITIIIPLLLAFNTIYLALNVRNDYDGELQTRAELANSILATVSKEEIVEQDRDTLDSTITSLSNTSEEVQEVTFIVKDSTGYRVLATNNENRTTSVSESLQFDIVYARKWPVARSISVASDGGRQSRAWNVATPIMDGDQVLGIVSSTYLASDVDEKFDATLARSYVIMVVSAIAVLVLLINHFRFIGYADLLRKQKEVNQTMSDFLSVATHELKAPMSIIKGYISNVVDGTFGELSQEVKDQLLVAMNQTDRLNDLVQDLLNVSRIEQGRIQFTIEPVNLSNITTTIVKNYQQPAEHKGLMIDYQRENDDVWVMADAGRVQEIVTNLVDNAVKYSLSGTIVVKHVSQGKTVITSVRDTGIGMSAEERSRLFQRFYRVRNEKTKDISGTGLGLWIIKQYIEKMGGKIEVDSLVGSGTEFRVSLPASEQPVK